MKKKNQFVELDIKYFTEKKPLVITKKIKKIEGDVNLMTLPNVSFFVMKITNNYQTKYSIYSKENFELIQNFEYNDKLDKINIMNENAIILYGYYMEIWVKNKSNIFIKNKTISIDITSNILINSKSSLLLYAEPDGILVWYIKENIPHNIITKIKMGYYKTNLFFVNNEDLLGVHLYHNHSSYIYFFQMKDFTIVKKMNITEKTGKDFKFRFHETTYISKISENKIICVYPKFNKNKTFFITIKIPEFIIGHKNKENSIFDFIIYKNYILFYTWDKKIKIYENSKCKLVQEINVKGFFSMIHLKDNYLLGSMTEYAVENDLKSLVLFQLNL
jgi:hypothetical protein